MKQFILPTLLLALACGGGNATAQGLFVALYDSQALPQDGEGWTVVEPSVDSRIIYVSNSDGNDSDDGLSEANAKLTIAAGRALLRDGYPDHLLLKRGDTFTSQVFGNFDGTDGGRAPDEPWLFGTYGTGARPKILTTAATDGILAFNEGVTCLAIIGLHFEPASRADNETPYGISLGANVAGANGILIEDCYVTGYSTNLRVNGYYTNVTIRRNVVFNSFSKTTHSQGLYSDYVDGLLVEENFFDHNGWIPGTTYEDGQANGGPTIYNHSMYITHHVRDATIRNNISSRASSMGLKFQPTGGTHYVTNNLFVGNGYGLQLGGGQAAEQVGYSGATIHATNNVIVEGDDHVSGGMGVTISNINAGTFSNNIIANRTAGTQFAISIQDGMGWETEGWGVRDFVVEGNTIYDWAGPVQILQPTEGDPLPVMSNIDFIDNKFQEPDIAYTGNLLSTYTVTGSVVSFAGGQYYRAYDATNANTTMEIVTTDQSLATWETNSGEASASPATQVSFVDATRTASTYAATLNGGDDWEDLIGDVSAVLTPHSYPGSLANTVNDWIRAGFEVSP